MPSPEALDFLLTRRSRPPKLFSPPGPDHAELLRLLTAAARVPDHGKLEPWRFVVLEGAGKARFAAAIRDRAAAAGQDPDKGALAFEQAPLAVAVVSSPKPSDKIPAIEQTLSSGNVALSLLNAALAAGWGASWMTGWAAYDRPLVEGVLGLAPHESVTGFVYLGSCTTPPPDRPRPDVPALVTWIGD
ncbi:MAG: nitroreductase family protein [Amaricoccus sp.]